MINKAPLKKGDPDIFTVEAQRSREENSETLRVLRASVVNPFF
jgi:hypothetical protein